MKRKDILLFAVVGVISAIVSIVISNYVFPSSTSKQQAEVVQPISPNFTEPDTAYYNSGTFDPTRQITIGQNANTDPFTGQ